MAINYSRNHHTRPVQAEASATGVSTDASGDVTLTFTDMRRIKNRNSVSVQASGGYVCNVQSVSGNTVTVRVFESTQGGTAAAAMTAVSSGTSVTDIHGVATGE